MPLESDRLTALLKLIAIVCGSAAALLLVVQVMRTQGVESEATAAWVQAVGSVVAILAGFHLASRQSREAAAKERRERLAVEEATARERAEGAAMLLVVLQRVLMYFEVMAAEADDDFDVPARANIYAAALRGHDQTLSEIRLQQLGDPAAIDALLKARGVVVATRAFLEFAADPQIFRAGNRAHFARRLREARNAFADLVRERLEPAGPAAA